MNLGLVGNQTVGGQDLTIQSQTQTILTISVNPDQSAPLRTTHAEKDYTRMIPIDDSPTQATLTASASSWSTPSTTTVSIQSPIVMTHLALMKGSMILRNIPVYIPRPSKHKHSTVNHYGTTTIKKMMNLSESSFSNFSKTIFVSNLMEKSKMKTPLLKCSSCSLKWCVCTAPTYLTQSKRKSIAFIQRTLKDKISHQ